MAAGHQREKERNVRVYVSERACTEKGSLFPEKGGKLKFVQARAVRETRRRIERNLENFGARWLVYVLCMYIYNM